MVPGARAALPAPTPGVVWGLYPQRDAVAAPRDAFFGRARDWITGARRYARTVRQALCAAAHWQALSERDHEKRLANLRARLHRHGLEHDLHAEALGCVADGARRSLGVRLYPAQLFAAAVLLDGRLAEMATGEGKTLAAGAAAASAALAGIPVHVITANDYLVARDAGALQRWYAALGLGTGAIVATLGPDARREQYRADIVYCTARELVFDYLRDGLDGYGRQELLHRASAFAANPAPPRLRGLCMAILDEADSVLLDEAVTPLVLSQPQASPERRAFLWQALALARELHEGEDFSIEREARRALLSARGGEKLAQRSATLGATWRMRRRAEEAVAMALAALHVYARDRDYVVDDGRVVIVDPHSGRTAPGRAWSQGLHSLVELKERVALSADAATLAQITYQRFFPRYLHICGMSGTLREARRELRSVYGLSVVAVPPRLASRRTRLPATFVAPGEPRWRSLVERIEELHASGRPILVGTASVADSEALSAALSAAAVTHRVLNARQHREEAAIVAQAGCVGAVTIATQMAGRGTDIALEPRALALGGLHVIDCQEGVPRRLARQLAGRCARQGDPGSCERWIHAQAGRGEPRAASILCRLVRYMGRDGIVRGPQWLLRAWLLAHQWAEETRCAELRSLVQRQDREWQRSCSFASAPE